MAPIEEACFWRNGGGEGKKTLSGRGVLYPVCKAIHPVQRHGKGIIPRTTAIATRPCTVGCPVTRVSTCTGRGGGQQEGMMLICNAHAAAGAEALELSARSATYATLT